MSITPFFHAKDYYSGIIEELESATNSIDMMYLAYIDGVWARRINQVLIAKVKSGVKVRLLIDTLGTFFEHIGLSHSTFKMLRYLQSAGIEVHYYSHQIHLQHTQHIKICLIDKRVLFFGGSNIADHYLNWGDNNFVLTNSIPSNISHVFNAIISGTVPPLLTSLPANIFSSVKPHAIFTIPGKSFQFETAILKLINDSTKSLRIQTWYFWPNRQICAALIAAVGRGVKVEINISQKNRIPIINLINHSLIHRLQQNGIIIYKWDRYFSHKKSYWNNEGDVLVGSANLDPFSLYNNWEMMIAINDLHLASLLDQNFSTDLKFLHETPKS